MAPLSSLARDEKEIATKNIVLLLDLRGISRKALAKALGYGLPQTLNTHISKPTVEFVERVAHTLEVPVPWLLDQNMDLKSARKLRGGI